MWQGAFDSNLSETPSQIASFDDRDSGAVREQRLIVQSVDTAASSEADFYSYSIAEQNINAENKCLERLPIEELKSASLYSQNIAMSEPQVIIDSVQLSPRSETTYSAQMLKVDDSSVSEHSVVEHTIDKKTADDIQAMSFAVFFEKSSTEKFEVQPVYLPMLSDLALNATVDDVPQQPIMPADMNATYAGCCVEPRDDKIPLEELVRLEMPEIDVVPFEMSEFEHLAEATINLPESACGVQELAIPEFGDFIIHSQSPEIATVHEDEIPTDPFITVHVTAKSDEKEVSIGTTVEAEMATGNVDDKLSVMAKWPVLEMQQEETAVQSRDAVQYEAAGMADTLTTAAQPRLEASKELLEAKSAKQSEADLSVSPKLTIDDQRLGNLDPDREMPASVEKFGDCYTEQDSMEHVVEEESVITHVDLKDMKSATLEGKCRHTDSEDEDGTETVTSDEWAVMEKERDAGFDVKLTDDVIAETYEQMPDDDDDDLRLARELVYDSTTDETSTEYDKKATACTSDGV